MKFWHHAFKNIFRNMRRTMITLSIISFGIISLFFTYGFIDYSFQGLREQTIRQGVGHIQIFHPSYHTKTEEMSLQYGISNPDSVIRSLIFDEDIRFTMKRIEFQGLISNGDKSDIFLGRGIEPKLEEKLSSVFVRLKSGSLLSAAKEDDYEVILGHKMAKNLNTQIGDYLTILTSTSYGAQNAIDLKLVGTFSTGIPQLDKRLIMTNLTAAQDLIDTQKISKLIVVLKETELTESKLLEYKSQLADYELRGWKDLAPFYQGVVNLYSNAFGLLSFIIVFIVILAVSNTTMMSITERTAEIGTMLAMGTSQRRLLANFVIEGFYIGILGSCFALVFGLILITIVNQFEFMMPPPPGSNSGYPVYINIVPNIWVIICSVSIVVSILASVLPAYRASRLNIVQSLAHV